MTKKTRILSLDGGGIKGIIPGTVLVSLEKKLQQKSKNPDARLSDYFDMISGTSTGGILTIAYLIPDKTNGRPKFSAQDAVNIYLDRGDEIFEVTLAQRIKSGGGVLDEKFSAKELEEALDDNFGDIKLSELLKPCLITSYDIRNRKGHFFKQHRAKMSEVWDFYAKDVARATSAAPTYFETSRIKSLQGTPFPLIDGGVFVNNPAMCAYAEARTVAFSETKQRPTAKDMFILSLGTGSSNKKYYYKDAKDWGIAGWIKPLIDIMMAGNSETVDYQLRQLFEAAGNSENYIRIEPELGTAKPEMDDASHENLTALQEAGLACATEYENLLDKVANVLIENSEESTIPNKAVLAEN